jgi:CDP-paratose 2-epimerase
VNLLITGGCGFLGSNIALGALKRGIEVTVFDWLGRRGAPENLQWLRENGVKDFRHGDMRNASDVMAVVAAVKPDAIFHLAGQVAMTTSLERPRLDFEINTLGTFNLLEAMRAHAPQALVIYSSTNKVYGDLEWVEYSEAETRWTTPAYPSGFDERTPLDFRSPYGCSKGAADQYILDSVRSFGLRGIVFRHSSMYGGRQFATFDQGWVGWFCMQAAQTARNGAHRFTISGDGKQVRDVLHADDMVSLYLSALDMPEKGIGRAFNIGAGMNNSLSLLELFGHLETISGHKLKFDKMPPRQSDQKVFVADIAAAGAAFGWTPGVSVETGLRNAYQWAQELV